mgnify:CR=1 FL=1
MHEGVYFQCANQLEVKLTIMNKYNIFKSKQFELRNNISQIFLREGVFNDIQEGLTVLVDKRLSKYDLEGIFIYDTRNINKESYYRIR